MGHCNRPGTHGPSACCAGAPVCPQGVWWVAGETVFSPRPCTAPASPYGQLCKPLLSLAAGAEPEASRRIAVAVLELGTVTHVPQSRNYQHLVWVSELEQRAAWPALPPAASRPMSGDSFVVCNNTNDDNGYLYWMRAVDPAQARCFNAEPAPPSHPAVLSAHLPHPGSGS